ncbi:MAG: L-2-hydroxyglutarate oxidase [Thermoanaerobaculia bacterium]
MGGGIVGLATAYRFLTERPGLRLALLEKESRLGAHQTGHNSGVIHTGLYYRPGSMKARLAVAGGEQMKSFCSEYGIPVESCGKVVVATTESESAAVRELLQRGNDNGVRDLRLLGPGALREIEPAAAGILALHVPHAAIVDYGRVADELGRRIIALGGEVWLGARVTAIHVDGPERRIESTGGEFRCRNLVTCCGLQSDRIARLEGATIDERIVPFRGEYYELVPERTSLVRGLIYPVPDPRFPFLGVHFTRRVTGGVEAGPNAVLALGREAYRRSAWNPRDAAETLLFPGFWRLARLYWRVGCAEEWRSLSRAAFVRSLQQLVPALVPGDLVPAASGVRAQALSRSGRLVDDFLLLERPRALHVANAPSPAATAAFAIAGEIELRSRPLFEI